MTVQQPSFPPTASCSYRDLDDSDKVEWVMESIKRGLNKLNAPLVYQVCDFTDFGELDLTNCYRLWFHPSS